MKRSVFLVLASLSMLAIGHPAKPVRSIGPRARLPE